MPPVLRGRNMEKPGEISTSTAAALLGVSYEMVRRLVRSGHIELHRRGWTTVPEAVQGYARFLREDAARAEANASAVRQHRAKAATVAAATSRRRAGYIARADAELAITIVADTACAMLRAARLKGRVPPNLEKPTAAEMVAAATSISEALALALSVLRGEAVYD